MKKFIALILFMALSFYSCADVLVGEPKSDKKMLFGTQGSGFIGETSKIMRIVDVEIKEENPKQIICIIKGYKIN